MKIIVLHGEDTNKSYVRLKKFIETAKARSWEITYIDEVKQTFEETLSFTSLFGNERFFVLRDVKKLGKKEAGWLSKNYSDLSGSFIIYHEGIINAGLLKSLPKDTDIEEFKLPKLLWVYLDSISPKNSGKSIKLFHEVIRKEPPEFVFSLISKLFRDLYWVKAESSSLPYPSWRTSKLKVQSEKFKVEMIREVIGKLAEIDIASKTSKADLISSLDLLMITKLE